MYTIKQFANLIGVKSTQTLRNWETKDKLKPIYISPTTQYRYYVDSQAYELDSSKFIVAYISQGKKDEDISRLENQIKDLNINYKILINSSNSNSLLENKALKLLLKYLKEGQTYTVLIKEDLINQKELEIIKLFIESCYKNIQVKAINEFTTSKNIKCIQGGNFNE